MDYPLPLLFIARNSPCSNTKELDDKSVLKVLGLAKMTARNIQYNKLCIGWLMFYIWVDLKGKSNIQPAINKGRWYVTLKNISNKN